MDFNIYAGAETGILKGINVNKKAIIQKNLYKQKTPDRGHEITAMTWGDTEEEEILLGLRGQNIMVYDASFNALASVREALAGKGPIVSLSRWNECIVSAVTSGVISVWKGFDKQLEIHTIKEEEQEEKNLMKLRQNPFQKNIFASCGKENPLQIWDLNKSDTPIFKEKNVRPDSLQLRVPIWHSDAAFMSDNNSIATCTRYKQIRLFDPRTQRRPVISFEWGDSPFTCIKANPSREMEVFAGTSHGRIGRFDLKAKKPSVQINAYKGFAGAVKDIAIHPTLPLVCSASLDRFVRIHNMDNSQIIHKEYMKSRINTVLIRSSFSENDIPVVGGTAKRPIFNYKEEKSKRIKA